MLVVVVVPVAASRSAALLEGNPEPWTAAWPGTPVHWCGRCWTVRRGSGGEVDGDAELASYLGEAAADVGFGPEPELVAVSEPGGEGLGDE